MRWRGQGILTLVVLTAAAAFAYQWTTLTHLQEEAWSSEIEYWVYTRPVTQFVEEHRRWPQPTEIALPKPPKGLIRNVELNNNGELLFTLSGWTIKHGYVTVRLLPELQTHNVLSPFKRARLSYRCVETIPAELQERVCMRLEVGNSAEINSKNATAFAEWEKNNAEAEKQAANNNANVYAVRAIETQCDRLLVRAQQKVVPCLESIDKDEAKQISEHIMSHEILNGSRPMAENIEGNSDILNHYNFVCDESWNQIVAMVKTRTAKYDRCFDVADGK